MIDMVVDASVASKWVLAEDDTPLANALLLAEGRLLAPRLLIVEVSSAVARAFRTGRLDRGAAEAAFEKAAVLFDGSTLALVDDALLLARAQALALELRHPIADCLYLALADRERATLVTTDQTFLSRTRATFSFVKALADV